MSIPYLAYYRSINYNFGLIAIIILQIILGFVYLFDFVLMVQLYSFKKIFMYSSAALTCEPFL
jgi:hypothetical protein